MHLQLAPYHREYRDGLASLYRQTRYLLTLSEQSAQATRRLTIVHVRNVYSIYVQIEATRQLRDEISLYLEIVFVVLASRRLHDQSQIEGNSAIVWLQTLTVFLEIKNNV